MPFPRRVAALVVAVALAAGACGDDPPAAGPSSTTDAQEPTTTTTTVPETVGHVLSRFLPDGYAGSAWPVPAGNAPGAHVNDVAAELLVDAAPSGQTVWLPAGSPVTVVDVVGDHAVVELDDGRRVHAARDELWRIGRFVEFKDIEVPIGDELVPIGASGLAYHRVGVNNFDDPSTDEFEGIASNIRRYLRCEADEWKIANQYFAVDVVADGIYEDDPEFVEKGVTAIRWGVAQDLAPDGVFSLYRECDGTTARDFSETHHSTQWFAALGRGIFALAASPHAGEYRTDIESFTDHLLELAGYLTTEPVRDHWRDRWLYEANGDVFTHKFYMRAVGLAAASALTDDPDDATRWSLEAREIAEEGMAKQWGDGVNPERGGFDVRYQMYGTWLGIVYRSMLDESDHRDELGDTINAALDWIHPKLDPVTGRIDFAGSTRSCTPRSNVNEYHPYHMISAYLLWAHLEPGNDHLYDLAVLADAGHAFGGNRCPAPSE